MKLDDFEEGERYLYSEMSIAAGYGSKPGGNFERGIILAPKDNPTSIMIKMNQAKNLYDDEFIEGQDWFYYIGDGLPDRGKHQRYIYGNKIMVENQDLPVHFFLRKRHEGKSDPWHYKGIWRITGIERDYISDRKMPNGELQRVFRFKLSYQGRLSYEREIYESKPKPTLSESDYTRITPAMYRVIEPKHNKLANQFRTWLATNDFEDIRLEQENIDVRFARGNSSFMAELKVVYDMGTTRSIREAMGQVFEYNLYPGRNLFDSWLIILDKKPIETDLSYIERINEVQNIPINLGWRKRKQFEFIDGLP
ncbi:MAG: hypothetical protein ACFFEV_07160 [Candidatus Thorarchaeota archaeon]